MTPRPGAAELRAMCTRLDPAHGDAAASAALALLDALDEGHTRLDLVELAERVPGLSIEALRASPLVGVATTAAGDTTGGETSLAGLADGRGLTAVSRTVEARRVSPRPDGNVSGTHDRGAWASDGGSTVLGTAVTGSAPRSGAGEGRGAEPVTPRSGASEGGLTDEAPASGANDRCAAGEITPLVRRGESLALHRLDAVEVRLAAALRALAAEACAVDEARLEAILPRLFPGAWSNPEQEDAVRAACRGRLLVLAGGPGTGKTTTVVRLLAALVDQARGQRPPRVLLLAPTGKAAARLDSSVRGQLGVLAEAGMDADAASAWLAPARTVHRALVPDRGWLTRFEHGPDRPFAEDVIVLDEASMVDTTLFLRVVEAVGPRARLLLLGDPHQLAAVGAGAVLASLRAAGGEVGARVRSLVRSRRFDPTRGIGRAARAILTRDPVALDEAWASGEAELRTPTAPLSRDPALLKLAVDGWRDVFKPGAPADRLRAMERFRVLCAMREGPDGVDAVNLAIEDRLAQAGLLGGRRQDGRGAGRRGAYEGRPVMITRNDLATGLSNGDTGLILPDEHGRLAGHFLEGERVRVVGLARLPPHELAYATTIHKAQGSEHDTVVVGLGSVVNRLTVNELVYTGLTRAKARVIVFATPEVLDAAVRRPTLRWSGLLDRLNEAPGV